MTDIDKALAEAESVIAKYGADADKPSVRLALAVLTLSKQLENVNASLCHSLREHNRRDDEELERRCPKGFLCWHEVPCHPGGGR